MNILKLNICKSSWATSIEIKWNIHINYRTMMPNSCHKSSDVVLLVMFVKNGDMLEGGTDTVSAGTLMGSALVVDSP